MINRENHLCQYCSKPMDEAHGSRQYCSQTCRQYAYLERKGHRTRGDKYTPPQVTVPPESDKQLSIQELKAIIIEQRQMYQELLDKLQQHALLYENKSLGIESVNYLSIDGIDSNQKKAKGVESLIDEKQIDQFKSRFLEDLKKFTLELNWGVDYEEFLSTVQDRYNFVDEAELRKAFEKIKSFAFALIGFSYRPYIPAWQLIQLHSAMCLLYNSDLLRGLRRRDSLIEELDFMIKKTDERNFEIENPNQKICFYLSRTTKISLLAMINNIGPTIKHQPFRFEYKPQDSKKPDEKPAAKSKSVPKYKERMDKVLGRCQD